MFVFVVVVVLVLVVLVIVLLVIVLLVLVLVVGVGVGVVVIIVVVLVVVLVVVVLVVVAAVAVAISVAVPLAQCCCCCLMFASWLLQVLFFHLLPLRAPPCVGRGRRIWRFSIFFNGFHFWGSPKMAGKSQSQKWITRGTPRKPPYGIYGSFIPSIPQGERSLRWNDFLHTNVDYISSQAWIRPLGDIQRTELRGLFSKEQI